MSNLPLIRVPTSISLVSVFVLSALVSCGGPLVPFDILITPPREGLIGEWLFENGLEDTSGSNSSVAVNSGSSITDRFNKVTAFKFSGYSEFTGPSLILKFTDTFSISGWLIADSVTYDDSFFVNVLAGTSNYFEIGVGIEGASQDLVIQTSRNGDGGSVTKVAAPFDKNRWVHIVAIYDKQKLICFENGEKVVQGYAGFASGLPLGPTNSYMRLGEFSSSSSSYPGILDDVRVYNRALSDDEIQRLYHEKGYGY